MVFDVDKRLKVICSLVMLAAIAFMPLAGMSDLQAQEDDTFHLGPLNPDFVKFFEEPPEPFYGYIPPPMDLSHLDEIPVERPQKAATLPNSFDWRDQGKVTPIKDQNPCGTCWVHGTLAAVESRVLIQESTEYDFSEQNLACCTDPAWVYLIGNRCNGGGFASLATDTLTKKGTRLEACQPYNTSTINTEACDDSCQSIKMVTDFRMIADPATSSEVIEPIKNAIYNHGPLAMSYAADDGTHMHDGSIYYWPDCPANEVNHLVCIVGWNDTVAHPVGGGSGAWIVKNSWGTGWGDNGYFYLCYGSAGMCEVASLDYKDYDPDETIYYWDEAGNVGAAGCSAPSAWMANIFTSAQDGNLTHVDFWTTSNNAQYDIYVYLDGDISDGLQNQAASQTGTCQEFGYYSIQLSSPVSLTSGQPFTIAVKMTTPGFNYPIPVESKVVQGGETIVDPPIQMGKSFARCSDTGAWKDLGTYGCNACLRARVTSEAAGQPDITVSPPSFDVTLASDTTQDYTLTIGNDGDADLTYSIGDRETTGESAPSAVQLPTGQFAERDGLIELSPSEPMSFATPPSTGTEIAYDDGVADDAWFGASGFLFAVRFTPQSYPVDLKTARICLYPGWPDADHEQFAVEVYDDDGVGGAPGSQLGATVYAIATDWGWWDVDMSALGITITSGDFYIAYKQLTDAPDCEGLCIDYTNPDDRSWIGYEGEWYQLPFDPIEAGDWMIRCVVEVGGGANNPPNIPSNPSPANHATGVSIDSDLSWTGGDPDPGDTVTYDVYFDTTGATTLVSNDQSATTYDPGTLSHNTKYYWKIVATDNHTASTTGPVWDFTTAAEDCPWLDVNPTSGSVAPGDSHDITVTIDTTGLGSNYSAEIVIASNDPDEDPVTVPVTLYVVVPTVSVDAPPEVAEGSNFVASVNISEVTNLFAAQYVVSFNTTVLELTSVTAGVVGGVTFPVSAYNPDTYMVAQYAAEGATGSGYLAELHFHVIGSPEDTSDIDLTAGMLSDTEAAYIPATWTGTSVEVVTPVIAGDANGDGAVNVLDLAFTARIIAGLEPNGDLHPGADANQDGAVNVLDLAQIARIIAGLA